MSVVLLFLALSPSTLDFLRRKNEVGRGRAKRGMISGSSEPKLDRGYNAATRFSRASIPAVCLMTPNQCSSNTNNFPSLLHVHCLTLRYPNYMYLHVTTTASRAARNRDLHPEVDPHATSPSQYLINPNYSLPFVPPLPVKCHPPTDKFFRLPVLINQVFPFSPPPPGLSSTKDPRNGRVKRVHGLGEDASINTRSYHPCPCVNRTPSIPTAHHLHRHAHAGPPTVSDMN